MRGEVILLVAGLAVAAALPVQEQVPSSLQSDLLKKILSANPGENDLHAPAEEKPSAALTKPEDQVTHTETVRQQTLPHQDPPQSLPQNSPQEQPQVQDTPEEEPQVQDIQEEQPQVKDTVQEQPQVQDTSEEEPQVQDIPEEQPQVQDTPQEQPQSQDPEEPSFPYTPEDEVPSEDSELTVWPEPQPILVYPQEENLPFEPEEPEGDDELNSDLEVRTFLAESDDGYVVLQANEEQPSLDTEGTFIYGLKMSPLPVNQEDEPFLSEHEEEYDSEEESLPFEPQMDSLPLEIEEPQMKPLPIQSQEDPLPYDSEDYFDLNPQIDSFPLHEEPLESDYEQLSQMDERPFNPEDYDYESPVEEDQPNWEEDMLSSLENAPAEKLYHESQGDTTVDLFSWLVPDFFDEEPTEYDESLYVTSYHDDMMDEDPFASNPEIQFESQVPDQTANWKETSVPEDFDDILHSHDAFLEDEEGMVEASETILPHEVGSMEEEEEDNVSLADFFIPVYNDAPAFADIPQRYSDSDNPEDGSEELVPLDEENYSVDDGLFHSEPAVKHYLADAKQDQPNMDMFGDDILFPENPSYEDEGYIFSWPAGDEDQTEYSEDVEPVTILESQPTYGADVETDVTYPSLQERTLKEFAGGDLIEPWSGAKSLMVDLMTDSRAEDNEIFPMERDYASDSLDNDAMDIIVVKDPRENFDNFPIRPLVDDIITQAHPMPIGRYIDDQRPRPYWVPQRIPDQEFPKIYFSITDERPRRKTPTFFDRMDEDVSVSSPLFRRTVKTPAMRNPFTFLNEVMDDDLPPQYMASSSPSRQLRYMGPDAASSPRNYPDEFKTTKFSFRDLLRNLNPSFYDDAPSNSIEKQSSPLYYPQSYNSVQHYNDLPQEFPHALPPVTYSSPFDSFQERDNSPVQNYYTDRPQSLSFYSPNIEPSSLFREDTMPRMYSRQPQRHFDDYTDDLPYMSSDSFSSSRFRFPFFQRPQYPATSSVYMRPHYSPNSFYGMGPYHPTPMYPRYAPEYY